MAQLLVALPIIAFVSSCCLPVLEGSEARGYRFLLVFPLLPWWANPLCVLGWWFTFQRQAARACFAFVLSLMLTGTAFLYLNGYAPSLRIGYYLWVLSIALSAAVSPLIVGFLNRRGSAMPGPSDEPHVLPSAGGPSPEGPTSGPGS